MTTTGISSRRFRLPCLLVATTLLIAVLPTALFAQPDSYADVYDYGPTVEKTFGQGLPRDGDTLVFSDDQYPDWPLTPEQQQYTGISGERMKQQVIDLGEIALRYRDQAIDGGDVCRAPRRTGRAWST